MAHSRTIVTYLPTRQTAPVRRYHGVPGTRFGNIGLTATIATALLTGGAAIYSYRQFSVRENRAGEAASEASRLFPQPGSASSARPSEVAQSGIGADPKLSGNVFAPPAFIPSRDRVLLTLTTDTRSTAQAPVKAASPTHHAGRQPSRASPAPRAPESLTTAFADLQSPRPPSASATPHVEATKDTSRLGADIDASAEDTDLPVPSGNRVNLEGFLAQQGLTLNAASQLEPPQAIEMPGNEQVLVQAPEPPPSMAPIAVGTDLGNASGMAAPAIAPPPSVATDPSVSAAGGRLDDRPRIEMLPATDDTLQAAGVHAKLFTTPELALGARGGEFHSVPVETALIAEADRASPGRLDLQPEDTEAMSPTVRVAGPARAEETGDSVEGDKRTALIVPAAIANAPLDAPIMGAPTSQAIAFVQHFPTVVVNGAQLGAITLRDFGTGKSSIHLGALLGLLRLRMLETDYARLSTAASADRFVTLDRLREAGIPIRYDQQHDRLSIGPD